MPANITETPQRSILIAHHHDRLARHIRRKVRLRIGNRSRSTINFSAGLVQRTHQLPGLPKDLRLLRSQNSRINVVLRFNGVRALNLLVQIDRQWSVRHERNIPRNSLNVCHSVPPYREESASAVSRLAQPHLCFATSGQFRRAAIAPAQSPAAATNASRSTSALRDGKSQRCALRDQALDVRAKEFLPLE